MNISLTIVVELTAVRVSVRRRRQPSGRLNRASETVKLLYPLLIGALPAGPMIFHLRRLLVRSLSGAVALAGLVVFASSARASCGDYVTVGERAHAAPSADDAPAAPAPCRGPHCSRREAPPPAAPVAPAPAPADDWACSAARLAASPPGAGRGRADDGAADPPPAHPSGVFHPPRPVRR